MQRSSEGGDTQGAAIELAVCTSEPGAVCISVLCDEMQFLMKQRMEEPLNNPVMSQMANFSGER